MGERWRAWSLEYGIYAVFAVLLLVMWRLSPHFLTVGNLLNIGSQISMIAVIAIGMTMVILMGEIDLSVGSAAALAGAITAGLIHTAPDNQPTLWLLLAAAGAGMGVGASIGLVNGLFTVWAGIPSFIVTLGMLSVGRGLVLLYTGGRPIFGFGDDFGWISWGGVGPLPLPIVIMLSLFILAWLFLRETQLGRYIYAIGSNRDAVERAGINYRAIKVGVFALAGALSGLAGIMLTARLDSAQPTAAMGWELDVIAAVVLGGTSLHGGRGSILKTLVGAFIIQIISNGLNLLNVQAYWQQIAKGAIILFALLLERLLRGRR
ncbi:MAG: ABC transporter permease [Desulfobacterales bacterium]|nr:ABC transporter permease [Desulfobacterales bacterium]